MNDYKEKFYQQLAGLAWSLWKELGVAGTLHFHEDYLIQPEELIILTMIISDYDPRLRDEALDWTSRYHEYVSITRLRTLLKEADPKTVDAFSRFATILNSVASTKWPYAEDTQHFQIKTSGKSLLPPLESPSLLMLRLRSLFGLGAKADSLTYFLTKNNMQFSAADLVELGYTKRSLMTALDQLATSGVITVTHIRNKKIYELKKPKELQVVVGKLPKIAPPWHKILKAIFSVCSTIQEFQNSSESTKSILLRNCLIKIAPLLPAFISPILNSPLAFEHDWKGLMATIHAFSQGNFFGQFDVYDEFEKITIDLLCDFYPVEDCVDGIELIQTEIQGNPARHNVIYKECYQLYLSFIKDLELRLKKFLSFPFHKTMDAQLIDITYHYSKENLEHLLEKMQKITPLNQITSAPRALREQQSLMLDLAVLRQFISTFTNHLQDLYFFKTNRYLLTASETLFKRRLVLELFDLE